MSEFARSDYLRIKWSFMAMAVSILSVIGLFAGLKALDNRATTALSDARTINHDAQERLDKISQEEQSIINNKGKYQIIKATGVVGPVDSLQMYEHFQQLRSDYNLFPIQPTFAKQAVLPLPYGLFDNKKVDKPGRPISLQMIGISFKMSLLHENDFANLLNGLLSQREFLQVHSCTLDSAAKTDRDFLRLSHNISADCSLAWYSFRIDDTKSRQDRKP